ncbi:gustatory receptor for sugar taste 64f-like [Bombyx mandarina]|uniref:Gustatory receptor for sugar taste 64f-like n=1 Tax=Bombyx mandarina TaxID=7092 RepID=A0A6J2K7U2_BOMMA|nr:gustatory receptor for sugar taste 64f-like [Bombyx mandarina]
MRTKLTPIIFYGVTFISMIAFIRASRRWPELIQHISKSEELDPSFDFKLKKKCNITLLLVLVLAILEHIFSIRSAYSAAQICYPDTGFYEGFVRYLYPWVFDFLPYSAALGMVTQFLNIQSHFIWNFTDLFVICMSYYLTSRLDLVNKKLLPAQGKYLPEIFWRTTRETYCRATKLVRKVDEIINGILFISFANNLFFVCVQLFNTFDDSVDMVGLCYNYSERRTKPVGSEPVIYLLFSLGFLISRSIAVSLIASQVNLASTVPAPILYDVPSAVYCVEVQRFLEQVNGDNVALTGLQFFSVTRGLLLSVAGTIVTYELVMVQFNQAPASDSFTEKIVENNISTIETFYNYS